MAKATMQGGSLNEISDCNIIVPGLPDPITFRVLPEITDSHAAHYNDEPIIGRSFPIKTFSHGDNRSIGMKVHFVTLTADDVDKNLQQLRALQSLTYPQDGQAGSPYLPPPIAKIKCGSILAGPSSDGYLCVVLEQYNVSFPTDVVLDDNTLMPWKFDVDLTWKVVFAAEDLPGNNFILSDF